MLDLQRLQETLAGVTFVTPLSKFTIPTSFIVIQKIGLNNDKIIYIVVLTGSGGAYSASLTDKFQTQLQVQS